MRDDEKAGFVRAFMIELADTVRALFPDDNLINDDLAFKDNPVERDEDGTLRAFIENQLVIKKNAHCTEIDALLANLEQTIRCLNVKHHLVESYMTYEHGTLLEFYSDGIVPGYGDFYLSPYFTARFKE